MTGPDYKAKISLFAGRLAESGAKRCPNGDANRDADTDVIHRRTKRHKDRNTSAYNALFEAGEGDLSFIG